MSDNGRYWGPRPDGPSQDAASGWWDFRSQMHYQRAELWPPKALPTDPYWENVALLLNFDGTDGSTSFVDESGSTLPVTASGSASITTALKRFGTGSLTTGADANGTANFISVPGDTLGMGSGDFTIEAFYLRTGTPTNHARFMQPANHVFGASRLNFNVLSSGQLYADVFGTVLIQSAALTWNANQWYHVALTRDGATMRLWRDGVQVASATRTNTLNSDTLFRVLCGDTTQRIDALRITKGVARYTANFVPPSTTYPLPTDPDFSSVSLLLPMNSSFADESSNAISVTANGDAQISTAESKFGGASGLFDGAGDFLSMTNASLPLGTGDFTIEGWLYRLGNTGESVYRLQNLVTSRPSESTSTACYDVLLDRFDYAATPKLAFGRPGAIVCSGGSVTNNTWHHVAVVRSSGTATVYINGEAVGSGSASTINDTQQSLWIAGKPGSNLGQFHGYLDDWRITKGIARYTANFTPPTAPFPPR